MSLVIEGSQFSVAEEKQIKICRPDLMNRPWWERKVKVPNHHSKLPLFPGTSRHAIRGVCPHIDPLVD